MGSGERWLPSDRLLPTRPGRTSRSARLIRGASRWLTTLPRCSGRSARGIAGTSRRATEALARIEEPALNRFADEPCHSGALLFGLLRLLVSSLLNLIEQPVSGIDGILYVATKRRAELLIGLDRERIGRATWRRGVRTLVCELGLKQLGQAGPCFTGLQCEWSLPRVRGTREPANRRSALRRLAWLARLARQSRSALRRLTRLARQTWTALRRLTWLTRLTWLARSPGKESQL